MSMSAGIHVNEPTNVSLKMLGGNTNVIEIEQKGEHGATPWDVSLFLPNDKRELENFLDQLGGVVALARRELIPETIKKEEPGIPQDGDTTDAVSPVEG